MGHCRAKIPSWKWCRFLSMCWTNLIAVQQWGGVPVCRESLRLRRLGSLDGHLPLHLWWAGYLQWEDFILKVWTFILLLIQDNELQFIVYRDLGDIKFSYVNLQMYIYL